MTSTVVEIAARGEGVSCTLSGDLVVPRLVRRRGRDVEVALVAGRAMLLPGDDVRIDIRVDAGCELHLVDIGGLVVYGRPEGDEAPARWHAVVELAPAARVTWEGLPTVVTEHGRLLRSTTLRMASGSSALLRETLVLGRTGESGGELRSEMDAEDEHGPLLRETLEVRGARPEAGVLGRCRVMDSIVALGRRLDTEEDDAVTRLELARGGTVLRDLCGAAHDSRLGELWRAVVRTSEEHPRQRVAA
jgi:urease accessory protein